ncbi:MAG: hypothetical protein KDK63_03300 [Chlamydiia bacterium]|nr:hypothetical protein [Chlamydiia bacterium]
MEFIGIQKEDRFFRLAYLSFAQGEIIIQCLEKEDAPPERQKNVLMVTGVEGQDLLIRHLLSPLKKKSALNKTLPFQLEPLIPYAIEEVVIKPTYYVGSEGTDAQFFCVPKKGLEKHIAMFQELGVDPDWISAVPVALYRFASFVAPMETSLVVFHVGIAKIQLVSVRDNKLHSHVTLHIGAKDLREGDSAKVVEKLKKEVDRALCFMAQKEEVSGVRSVLFCGEKAKEVETLLKQEEGLIAPIEIDGHRGFSGESVLPYAIPIGLALDALKNDKITVQFRQDAYLSKRAYKTIKKGLIRGGVLGCVLLIFSLIFHTTVIHKKEKALVERVKNLMAAYETSLPALKGGPKGGNIEEILLNINSRLKGPKKGESLYETPPLVADLLAFISSHPCLEGIDVKRLDFTLSSYPTLKRPSALYRPKVHLVFSTPEANKARAFHDAIVENEEYIDKEEQVEWKRQGDTYEIFFFLRA